MSRKQSRHVFDRTQSLQAIEGEDWGEPSEAPTDMIASCLRLRRVPVGELSLDNLRLMIGQRISLHILIPLALETLLVDPWIEVSLCPGDLLAVVLKVGNDFWTSRPDLLEDGRKMLAAAQHKVVPILESAPVALRQS